MKNSQDILGKISAKATKSDFGQGKVTEIKSNKHNKSILEF